MSSSVSFIDVAPPQHAVAAGAPVEAAAELPLATLVVRRPWWRRHAVILALLAFTLVGGALRFLALDRPSLWGDEAATYMRISGTYRELVERLQIAWFPPLHYQLYFWLSRHIPMDPFGMRLMPAIAGTLMIPAMYFLARQLVSVRDSLMAAGFTAVSAYMLAYSRDGKMYMEFWLFVAVSTGCLFWWLRTNRGTAWLAWVASGLAMVGLHGMGFAMLAMHALFFLTGKRASALTSAALVSGLIIISAGDAVHYGAFNRVAEQIEEQGWSASGIDWTETRNRGEATPLIVADTAAAYLFSFLWIQEKPPGKVVPGLPTLMAWALGVVLALLVVGAMPWGGRLRGSIRRPRCATPRRSAAQPTDHSDLLESPWRTALWLSMWIVAPAYAVYCASNDAPVSPAYWIEQFGALVGGHWLVLAAAVVSACALTQVSSHAWKLLAAALLGGVLWALGEALLRSGDAADLDWATRWGLRLLQPWLFGGLLGATAALWFDRSGDTIGQRLATSLRFVLIVGGLLLLCAILYAGVDGYFERRGHVLGQEGSAVTGRKSIWMPRWLAIVWPAVTIVVAVLLMRLPTRPLRCSAIACLVALNLVQFTARLTAGTEAPMARIATDIIAGQDGKLGDGRTWTYVQPGQWGAAPGMASIDSLSGRYYVYRVAGTKTSPREFLAGDFWQELTHRRNVNPKVIAAEVNGSPQVKRLVVWTYHRTPTPIKEDFLLSELGPTWRAAGDETHAVRTFWNWAEFFKYRRREFVRAGE